MRAASNRAGLTLALLLAVDAAVAASLPGTSGAVLNERPQPVAPDLASTTEEGAVILERMAGLRARRGKDASSVELRPRQIEMEGRSYGMRAGVAWRYGQIEAMLEQYTPQIDIIFNFAPLLFDEIGLPPIISEFQGGYRLETEELASSTRVGYRIEHPARLVSAAPTWREFLVKRYPFPEDPHPAILPKNDLEDQIWDRAVRLGWERGVEQADTLFETHMSVLSRALRGMLLYHRLVREQVISRLTVARSGETIEIAGQALDIGRIIYRVPAQPQWREPEDWQPQLQDPIPVTFPR